MKIFFITDLEGIAGVDKWSQIDKEQPIGLESMAQLTKEVNACVDGILSVEENAQVFVWDAHGSGGIIKETAAEACRNFNNVPPLKIDPPYEFEIRYTNPRDFSQDKRPGLTQIDSHTIVIRSDNLRDFPI